MDKLGLSMKLKESVSSKSLGLLLLGNSIGGFSFIGYQNHSNIATYQISLSYNSRESSAMLLRD